MKRGAGEYVEVVRMQWPQLVGNFEPVDDQSLSAVDGRLTDAVHHLHLIQQVHATLAAASRVFSIMFCFVIIIVYYTNKAVNARIQLHVQEHNKTCKNYF